MSKGQDQEPLHKLVMEHWPAAQAHWSRFLLLSDPQNLPGAPSVAQIHLGSRQVLLNFELIQKKGLTDCLEALLAHEVGHHVRYPATLAVEARLRLLERSLIPIDGYSLTNLFTDLMINEQLGRTMSEKLARIYRAFGAPHGAERDPAFVFYLAIYEELWGLMDGSLMDDRNGVFAMAHPGYRSEVRLLVEKLFNLEPNIYTQFLYFASVLSRYLKPPELEKPESQNPTPCHADEPTPDDWADALRPSAREASAVKKGVKEGWLSPEDAEKLVGQNSLQRRIASLPGMHTGCADQVPEIMAAYYRREAERYLFQPPAQKVLGDPIVQTTTEDWQWGDAIKEIDWLQTLLRSGPDMGAVQPLKRSRVAEDEGYEAPLWRPYMEVYLDVSGSMPDPRHSLNAMTLAALILVTASMRKGGWARALLYSTDHVSYWNWCRSENELSRFLMHYIGAGTEFPFGKLAESIQDCGPLRPIRVVITDSDFNENFRKSGKAPQIVREAAVNSSPLVLLLHAVAPGDSVRYRDLGAKVIEIADLKDLPKMASRLAAALFQDADTRIQTTAL